MHESIKMIYKELKMVKKMVLLTVSLVLFFGCATHVNLRSFTNPSIQGGTIQTVAILPVRNNRILPGDSMEMARSFTREFLRLNPGLELINAAQATDMLVKANLADKYADFLRDYAVSGIPNSVILKEIGAALNVDAIAQGEIFDLIQKDGHYPGVMAVTSLVLRYSLLSTDNGDVLWEASCSASSKPRGFFVTVWSPPPPFSEVIEMAQQEVLKDLPYLGY